MTFRDYIGECRKRWHGEHLHDARQNWHDFEEIRNVLVDALREYKRNPSQIDLSGKHHNPDHTLNSFLWKLQTVLNADRSSLYPLLDFEDHFQRVFLRRGLIIYCIGLLGEIEQPMDDAAQLKMEIII